MTSHRRRRRRLDLVVVLDHRVGWKTAVFLREAHRAPGGARTHPKFFRGGDLRGEQIPSAAWMDIEMVRRGRTTSKCELGEADPGRELHRLLAQSGPQRIERAQPVEKRRFCRRRIGPRQILIDVVMGIDKAGCDQAAICAKYSRCSWLISWLADADDAAVRNRHPPRGISLPAPIVTTRVAPVTTRSTTSSTNAALDAAVSLVS